MKKLFFLLIALLIALSTASIAAAGPIVLLEGREIKSDAPLAVEGGLALIPFRAVFEALGAVVEWDEDNKTATATRSGTEIKLIMDGGAYINGSRVELKPPARIIDGRTLVSPKLLEEVSGVRVKWSYGEQKVSIFTSMTELIWAAYNGEEGKVKKLLASGSLPDDRDYRGWTALNWASFNGYPGVVKELLSAGADPDVRDKSGWNAFRFAVSAGHTDVVRVFIKAGADPNDRDNDGGTALANARKIDVVRLLLSAGADPNNADSRGLTPLMWYATGGSTEVVQALLAAGANVNTKDKRGWTPLMYSAMDGDTSTAKVFISAGADVNARNNNNETALILANRSGHPEIVELLN